MACDGDLQRKKINTDDHLSMCNCSGGTDLDKAVKFRISRSAWCTISRGERIRWYVPRENEHRGAHFRGWCTNSLANLCAGARLRGGERIRCYTGPYNSLCRHLPSSSHRENFCSNCVLRSISILKRSQEIGLRRHPAWIPPNVEGGSLRWKPNTRKELSKATEKGERLGFFRGAPKPETTPTVRGRVVLL